MKLNKKMIKKSISKILIILIFVGLNWTGLLTIGQTIAYFSDTENSNDNAYQTGTLDLSLRSGQSNFVPPEIANDMDPGESVARDIYIEKGGSLPFQYDTRAESIPGSCDLEFYNLLELKVWYNYYTDIPQQPNYHKHRIMDLKYDGPLKDFDLITDSDLQIPNYSHPYYPNVFYGPDEHWLYFSITYPSEALELTEKQCQFKFTFEGWQTNLLDSSFGFSDTEEIYSTLTDSIFVEEEPTIDNSSIVINEFLPIAGDYPEFIEFYNKGDVQLDIADWIIENKDTTIVINSNILYGGAISTIIEPGKWLVIDLSKVGEDILDNTSDIITLYDSENNEIDTISYVEASMADKSYARIPDGSPNWVDPIPTPGAPNKLEEEIKELEPEVIPELQLEEVIEEIPLIATTTTTSTIPDSDILENSTTTSTTIPDQTTSITTEPLVEGATTSATTVPIVEEPPIEEPITTTTTTTTTEPPVPVEETIPTTTTTTVPPVEEPTTITTTTTIEPPIEETITTTEPSVEEPATTTTEPSVEEPPIEVEEPITTTTTTTTTEPPVEETIPTTTTITEPPALTDSEPDDSTIINLINIYFA